MEIALCAFYLFALALIVFTFVCVSLSLSLVCVRVCVCIQLASVRFGVMKFSNQSVLFICPFVGYWLCWLLGGFQGLNCLVDR